MTTNNTILNCKLKLSYYGLSAVFILLFTSISILTSAQDSIATKSLDKKKLITYFDLRFENGMLIEKESVYGKELFNNSSYNGFDLRIGFRKSDPTDIYSNVYRRPYIGFGTYFSTFHNSEVGYPFAFYFFFTHPFVFETHKKLTFSYSGAFGIAFNFNPYDSIANPANKLIGSQRNAYVHLAVLANYKFSEKLALNGTVGLKHFSNGSVRLPNNGINIIPLTLGVSYKLSDAEPVHYKKPIPDFQKYNMFSLMLGLGNRTYSLTGTNYLKTTLGLNYLRQISYKHRLGLGMDLFYSEPPLLPTQVKSTAFSDKFFFAVVGSWEWVLSKKLYVPMAFGVYLNQYVDRGDKKPYYERIGISYMINSHIHVGVNIKAHKDIADYFEWTLQYSFHKDPNFY